MTRRANARLDDITVAGRLPAFNRAAVKHLIGFLVHFFRLICLYEFLPHSPRLCCLRVTIRLTYGESLSSTKMPSFAGVRHLAGVSGIVIMARAICASSRERGSCGASSSTIFRFFGFSVTSRTVGNKPTPSFSLIRPTFCSRSRERPRLVGSLGTATC